jgi:hypothetical protein
VRINSLTVSILSSNVSDFLLFLYGTANDLPMSQLKSSHKYSCGPMAHMEKGGCEDTLRSGRGQSPLHPCL